MSFTNAQKADIRRHCYYPVFGSTPSSAQSYRFFQAFGTLEYRMNNLLAEEETIVTAKIANLNTLETAISGASTNLDTDQAAVWKHNKNEVRDRIALYGYWRVDLCDYLGVPLGPRYASGSGLSFVV